MYTLRCTRKLLDRGLAPSSGPEQAPTTVLGDWYATLLPLRPQQLVLCVSERSLLPLVLPAREARSLPQRLAQALPELLAAIEVPKASIEAELLAMQDASRIGTTASRSVLGSLNQLSYLLEGYARQYPGRTLLEHSLHLAGTPMTALGRDAPFPDIATRAAFSAAGLFARIAART
ncbi:DUF6933 domain-containing protein [Roseateles sp.]|uniref:DUF6933 domain-containing protein n=1 Tax=Roseateles sp. TaxID=1971397 RepID=UPI003D099F45